MMNRQNAEQGFTLIEAMIALAILGISAVGIIRAAEAHLDTMHKLEQRAAAQMVAENALVETRLVGFDAAPSESREMIMLQWRWNVRVSLQSSDDPDLELATVRVSPSGSNDPLVTLRGFVDRETITR